MILKKVGNIGRKITPYATGAPCVQAGCLPVECKGLTEID